MLRSTCLAALFMLTAQAHAADLTVQVNGVRSTDGTVRVALFDRADTFLKADQNVAAAFRQAMTEGVTFVFKDLPAGTYAAAIFHDENGDKIMNTNVLNIPTEGIAFSNNATGSFGPPSFDDAAVTLSATDKTTTSATLSY